MTAPYRPLPEPPPSPPRWPLLRGLWLFWIRDCPKFVVGHWVAGILIIGGFLRTCFRWAWFGGIARVLAFLFPLGAVFIHRLRLRGGMPPEEGNACAWIVGCLERSQYRPTASFDQFMAVWFGLRVCGLYSLLIYFLCG